jgi:hypothetical protein
VIPTGNRVDAHMSVFMVIIKLLLLVLNEFAHCTCRLYATQDVWCVCVRACVRVFNFFIIIIKLALLPRAILHAVGVKLSSITGDTVASNNPCWQSLYSLYNFNALFIV